LLVGPAASRLGLPSCNNAFAGECNIALEEAEICTNIDDPRLSTP
jgi:hypothetical protein